MLTSCAATRQVVFLKIYVCMYVCMYVFIYFWLHRVFVATCGPSLVCSERGLLFAAVHGLLIAVASLVAEHGL